MFSPVAAIGLAASIIQLTDFTAKIISKSRELHGSAQDVFVEYQELETITRSLRSFTRDFPSGLLQLSAPLSGGSHAEETETDIENVGPDEQLLQLSKGCCEISDTLLSAIDTLKMNGPKTKWKSFRKALKSIWSKKMIEKLEMRVERYRSQLNTALLLTLRQTLGQENMGQSKKLDDLITAFREESQNWYSVLRAELQASQREISGNDIASFVALISERTAQDREIHHVRQIHEALRFDHMSDRYEDIPLAYRQTYEWIFKEPKGKICSSWDAEIDEPVWDNYKDWLRGTATLYWITGKPGSGKSTLMKYIFNDVRTCKYLKQWAGNSPIIMAAFFFWNSGTTMQMSRLGLLQSLLHQVLKHCSRLVAKVLPDRWLRHRLFGGDSRPFTWTELSRALKTFVSEVDSSVVFFIDGLDEFDGDCSQLADFVLELSQPSNVKVCTGSRPWLVFEEKFENRESLKIHELTKPDIEIFVTQKLGASTPFQRLEAIKPQHAMKLIEEVTDKASGVFLWVHLVVQSLLEGLRDGDDLSDLDRRLMELPSDLESLFEKILSQLDRRYYEQALKLFRLVQSSFEPPSLLTLHLSLSRFEQCLSTATTPFDNEELQFVADNMRRRLVSRTKGLLEVRSGTLTHLTSVNYIHKTVKDFFEKPAVQERIRLGTTGFDPHEALAIAFLLEIKAVEMDISEAVLTSFWRITIYSMGHINKADTQMLNKVAYLDELNRSATAIFQRPLSPESSVPIIASLYGALKCPEEVIKMPIRDQPHWVNTQYMDCVSKMDYWQAGTGIHRSNNTRLDSFFDLCFQAGVQSYIQARIPMLQNLYAYQISGISLLNFAVSLRHLGLMRILLEKGWDPNWRTAVGTDVEPISSWEHLLCTIKAGYPAYEATTLFLDHAADVEAVFERRSLKMMLNRANIEFGIATQHHSLKAETWIEQKVFPIVSDDERARLSLRIQELKRQKAEQAQVRKQLFRHKFERVFRRKKGGQIQGQKSQLTRG